MTELRSHARVGDTLYLISTGDVCRNVFETVVFAYMHNKRGKRSEVHREYYSSEDDAVNNHKEIFNSLKECQ
jgi:hypothetical protein